MKAGPAKAVTPRVPPKSHNDKYCGNVDVDSAKKAESSKGGSKPDQAAQADESTLRT